MSSQSKSGLHETLSGNRMKSNQISKLQKEFKRHSEFAVEHTESDVLVGFCLFVLWTGLVYVCVNPFFFFFFLLMSTKY